MGSPLSRFSFIIAIFAAFAVSAVMAVEVATVAELEAAIANGDTPIMLTESEYALTKTLDFQNVANAVIIGRSDNPRDTVIYGDGTFRIINLSKGGRVCSLTVSNGYYAATGRSYAAGGIHGNPNGPSSCVVSNCIVTCCQSEGTSTKSGYGAGLAHCMVYRSQICGNATVNKGGGGGLYGSTVYDSEIFGNTAAGMGGGAVDSTFYRCRIFNNESGTKGGGVAQTEGYTAKVLDHSVVSNNTAKTEGGGCQDLKLVADSEIVFNKVSGGPDLSKTDVSGGGLKGCTLVSNCVIRGNAVVGTAKSRSGGAAVGSTLVDCPLICDNYVESGYASALMACTAINCMLTNNVATGSNCSALRKVTAERCTFYGGTVDSSGSTAQISSFTACQFLGHSNAAGAYVLPVGANVATNGSFSGLSQLFYLGGSTTGFGLYMTNCLIAQNQIVTSWILNKSASIVAEFVNCTFVDNHCKYTVRGVDKDLSDHSQNTKFVNTIFCRNYNNSASRVSFSTDEGVGMTFDHCIFELPKVLPVGSTLVATFDLPANTDMKFDAENVAHPYSLKRKSPAVDKGLYQDWMASATDLKGDARAHDTSVAIGCYECWLSPPGLQLFIR